MKILFLVNSIPPGPVGGCELQAIRLATCLRARGEDVRLLTIAPGFLPRRSPVLVPSTRLLVPGWGRLRQHLFSRQIQGHIERHAASIDLVHVHQASYPAVAAVRACRACRIPVVVKLANAGERFDLAALDAFDRHRGRMVGELLAHTSRFISISPSITDALIEWTVDKDRITEIPNGVAIPAATPDAASQRRFREEHRIPEDRPLVAAIGSLTRKKNFPLLLQAFETGGVPPLSLCIAGEGEERRALEEGAARIAPRHVVRLPGHLPPEQIDLLLSVADCFVLPSRAEGLSNALLEAMARGCPPLVSDIPANAAVLGELHPELSFPVDDGAALARGIARICRDPSYGRILSDAVRRRAEDRYSMDSVASDLLALYSSLRSKAERGEFREQP